MSWWDTSNDPNARDWRQLNWEQQHGGGMGGNPTDAGGWGGAGSGGTGGFSGVAAGAVGQALNTSNNLGGMLQQASGTVGAYLNRLSNLRGYYRALNANRQQDANIRNVYNSLDARSLGYVDKMFGQQKTDVANEYNNMYGSGYQDLIGRGLTGSTVATSLKQEVASQRAMALNRVDAAQNEQRLRADVPITLDAAHYLSGVKNSYPNYNPSAAVGATGYGF